VVEPGVRKARFWDQSIFSEEEISPLQISRGCIAEEASQQEEGREGEKRETDIHT
jgi:hypothetical protein